MKQSIFRSIFLLLLLAIMLSARAEIRSGVCGAEGDNVQWTLDTETGVLNICGTGDMRSGGVIVGYVKNIRYVVIEQGVSSIGGKAFDNFTGLISITIPNSVTSIGERAFYGCSGLTSITIPNSVTNIGAYAFYGCSRLTSITIPNLVTNIFEKTFYDCSGLTSITIPSSVSEIREEAFYYCNSLKSVNISDIDAWCKIEFAEYANPVSYAHHLFFNGEEIKDLTIPSSVTSIGESAFYGCSGLTSVAIPSSVHIPEHTRSRFRGCSQQPEGVK